MTIAERIFKSLPIIQEVTKRQGEGPGKVPLERTVADMLAAWDPDNLDAMREMAKALRHLRTAITDRQWQPIETAPKDNARPLYLARFDEHGKLDEIDFDGTWEYWEESWELSHINGWVWTSAKGIEEPTHWAYQDIGAPPPIK